MLTAKQRVAAQMRANGSNWAQIGRELGDSRQYWHWLYCNNHEFSAAVEYYISILEREYLTSTRRLLDAVIEQQLAAAMLKQRRKVRQPAT